MKRIALLLAAVVLAVAPASVAAKTPSKAPAAKTTCKPAAKAKGKAKRKAARRACANAKRTATRRPCTTKRVKGRCAKVRPAPAEDGEDGEELEDALEDEDAEFAPLDDDVGEDDAEAFDRHPAGDADADLDDAAVR